MVKQGVDMGASEHLHTPLPSFNLHLQQEEAVMGANGPEPAAPARSDRHGLAISGLDGEAWTGEVFMLEAGNRKRLLGCFLGRRNLEN